MAVQFRLAGAASQSASAASLTPALPTPDTEGNGVFIAALFSANNAVHANGTAGWTQVGSQTNSGAGFTGSLWIAAQSASAPAFTWTGAAACGAVVLYYSDPDAVTSATIGAVSVATGSTGTHASSSITSGHANSLAVLIDLAAANTALGIPAGWTDDADAPLSTAVAFIAERSKALGPSGTASGATSVSGANAAWVAWQIEIQEVQPTPGFQSSKLEVAIWQDPPSGFDSSKLEVAPWFEPPAGFDCAKIEVGLWLVPFPVEPMPIVYPTLPGLGFSQKWTPKFFNSNATTSSGAEADLGLAATPLHDFELTYNFLRDGMAWRGSTEFKTLIGFVMAMQGSRGRCMFRNKDDNAVFGQSIGAGDGSTRLFTLVRTFGSGEYAGTEPIGWLDETQPLNIYLAGVLQDPSSYVKQNTPSSGTPIGALQQVLFNVAPGNGVAITADINFYYHCKLQGAAVFEKFMNKLWLTTVLLRSCRPGA